jgi:hypothetical protein
MASDYAAIREANKAEYGNVGRWGRDLLVNRYDSSAHFVFELLQNAEDAMRRRNGWSGPRKVWFELFPTHLRVVHYGKPFTFEDVKGVCGVGETTKHLTDIGRFGIGFKSVYAITDRPEVHSGEEDFAIENFAFPIAVPPTSRAPDETEFIFPLRNKDANIFRLLADSLGKLEVRTLLFLREIKEISWSVSKGGSGCYLKEVKNDGAGCRRVALIGQRKGKPVVEENWLVFSREAKTEDGALAGHIEIAFLLQEDKETKEWAIHRVHTSPLWAFFPTVVTTHLGFLVQGPYRTTPSRDNVPPQDPWNVKLVQETAALLVDALRALKEMNLLDVTALQCLPIERAKYPEGSMFAPLFDAVRSALASEPLLPRAAGGWTAAKNARLARTQELRELFDSKQLAALLNAPEEVHWLSGDITRDTASTLRNYLLYELNVSELTPELILPRLTKQFLEAQPDEWILRLYDFLGGQSALVRQGRVGKIPLVRIEDGTHVVAESNGQPQAFLPSAIKTDFPTVRRSVCGTEKALEFLKALGLTEPDAVDDVVRNIIPKYEQETVKIDGDEYEADIRRMLNAFDTQHRGQRDKLIAALKGTTFVMSVEAGDDSRHLSKPGDVYLGTQRLKELFAGVPGVMLVDDSYSCLRGEDIREMIEACGAVRYLRPMSDNSLSWQQLSELRVQAGHPETSGQNDRVTDWTLLGLDELLSELPRLDVDKRRTKARLLWEELGNLEERRGKGVFTGEYTWTHYGLYRRDFDAAFVRKLNETAWVPDGTGNLQRPELVLFETLGWEPNPFLQSKIRFKAPILEQLAKEAGIEPGVLDLLKKRGVTSEAQLRELLGVEEGEPAGGSEPRDVDEALKKLGITEAPTAPAPDPTAGDPVPEGVGRAGAGTRAGTATGGEGQRGGGTGQAAHKGTGSQSTGTAADKPTSGDRSTRSFISYVATHPGEEEPDPDGLDHEHRLALEAKAIEFILSRERQWQRTPPNNPGFDLYQAGSDGQPVRWCEVKAMTGTLHDRPVGLSRMQFECAREHGEAYWLYVVECAGTDEARLIRIQDPAGKARTFTFDHGWLDIAETDSEEEP